MLRDIRVFLDAMRAFDASRAFLVLDHVHSRPREVYRANGCENAPISQLHVSCRCHNRRGDRLGSILGSRGTATVRLMIGSLYNEAGQHSWHGLSASFSNRSAVYLGS